MSDGTEPPKVIEIDWLALVTEADSDRNEKIVSYRFSNNREFKEPQNPEGQGIYSGGNN